MCSRSLSLAAAALLATRAVPSLAAEPIGAWKIEPSDFRCVAARQYGPVDKPIMLAVKAPPSESEVLQLAIMRPGYLKSADQAGAKLTINGDEFDTYALIYPLAGEKKQKASLFNLSPAASAALRKAASVSVSVKGGIKEEFAFGPSASLWTGLNACLERVRDTWNIGDERAGRLAQEAKGSLQAIFSPADYPRAALSEMFSGKTAVMLLIDETGSVKDCTLLETSGMAVLDSRTCGVIMQRAKFTPAIGLNGKPAKSAWLQRINWRLQR